jgi:hypothetical protein
MSKKNKAHYAAQGQARYEAGVIVLFGAHRGWQHAAQIEGYNKARDAWKAKNPGADELEAARERNRKFCEAGLAYKKGQP